jgi:hypothetical protein
MKPQKTILNVQSEIEAALQRLPEFAHSLPDVLKPLERLAPPRGTCVHISLRHAGTDRQVKRSAPSDSWSPEAGLVSISYESSPSEGSPVHTGTSEFKSRSETIPGGADTAAPNQNTVARDRSLKSAESSDPVIELVRALAKAEQTTQFDFVALKWFRDTFLTQEPHAWAAIAENRQRLLVDAINRHWILTSKVPNPRNPQFPVTAIAVNRPLPEVRAILGAMSGSRAPFAPTSIRGESLSETILRERR